jgi:hypothetical protein
MFLPVQSQPLNTCSSAIFPPDLMSGLVKVIAFAALALTSPATASKDKATIFRMTLLPLSRRSRRWPPA